MEGARGSGNPRIMMLDNIKICEAYNMINRRDLNR